MPGLEFWARLGQLRGPRNFEGFHLNIQELRKSFFGVWNLGRGEIRSKVVILVSKIQYGDGLGIFFEMSPRGKYFSS